MTITMVIIDNNIVTTILSHFFFINIPVNDQYIHIEHIKTKIIEYINTSAIMNG